MNYYVQDPENPGRPKGWSGVFPLRRRRRRLFCPFREFFGPNDTPHRSFFLSIFFCTYKKKASYVSTVIIATGILCPPQPNPCLGHGGGEGSCFLLLARHASQTQLHLFLWGMVLSSYRFWSVGDTDWQNPMAVSDMLHAFVAVVPICFAWLHAVFWRFVVLTKYHPIVLHFSLYA